MLKNIVILEDSSKVKFGGGQKGTLEIIDVFKDKNIILFDCSEDSLFQSKLPLNISKKYLMCSGKIIKGSNSSFSIGIKEIFFGLFLIPLNIMQIINFINLTKLDIQNTIFYTSSKKLILILYIIKKIKKIKYIFHARTYDNKKSFFYKIISIPLANANKIICVSNFIKNNINLKNCYTVYNPLTINSNVQYTAKEIKDYTVVAFVGELIEWKGIKFFIESYQYLNSKKNIKYHIYGEGSQKNSLMEISKFDNIIFKGFNENISDEYKNNIDILVVPSISPESFGRTSLEAAEYGIPCIASNLGGQKELITLGEYGLLIDEEDAQQIAKSVDYLVSNPEEYIKLSKNALSYSKSFSQNNFYQDIQNLFMQEDQK